METITNAIFGIAYTIIGWWARTAPAWSDFHIAVKASLIFAAASAATLTVYCLRRRRQARRRTVQRTFDEDYSVCRQKSGRTL